MAYQLSCAHIQRALTEVAASDADVRRALSIIGYPEPRRRPEGFETLLRIVVGQQVSIHAAAAINARLLTALKSDVSPERLLKLREPTLRKVGLSAPKRRYVRCLARALVDGSLDLRSLRRLPEEEAMDQIQSVVGLGRWSAQIYLMFSLGRPDIWPRADVGAMRGLWRIKGPAEPYNVEQAEELVAQYAPVRSAVALLCWRAASATAL